MANSRDTGERRRLGRIAGAGSPVLVALMVATMPTVGYSGDATLAFALVAGPAAVVSGALCWLLPWDRWPDRALLVVPLVWWAALSAFGLLSGGKASAYGFSALLFLFVGLSQPRWTSLPLLVPAVVTQFALYDGWNPQLVARLPVSVVTWVATAEIVTAYRARTADTVSDLERRVSRDPLTGCWNRTGLPDRLAALRPGDALLLVDLDYFKDLNDTLGHGAGDEVLRDFGAVLERSLREPDRAIRYGGEEFLLLLPSAGLPGALKVDARLRASWADVRPDVTYSGGVSVVPDSVASHDEPLAQADVALYAAKKAGRDRTHAWVLGGPTAPGSASGVAAPAEVAALPGA